ncbi:hypothetical protein FOC1_g10004923 [Fusarium oxysporum f. sp. cubense race 1]|uniref:Transmembrane protein n=1 Tax=Fusarium oxysporum f. sp. cubense (strain race 1) TaxID=1229664 RepID=N4UZV8_FUSC1|nr:hypothetical protein FOC1_g10004923 [Fusarium oxysporum f. sp. cubense race 1]
MAKCKEHPLDVDIDEKDLSIGLTTHGLLILIAALSCLVACLVSAYLIYKHAQNFTKPSQQRQTGKASNGQRWFNTICVGILQFCIVKFLGALVKCTTEAAVRHRIAEHQPMLKFLAIKLVIMVFYIQSFVFSFITKPGGPVKPSEYISYPSWAVGIPNALLCIEMGFASILHLYAFPYRPYQNSQTRGNEGSEALGRTDQSEGEYQGLNTADSHCDSIWSEGTKLSAKPQASVRGAVLQALGFKEILQGIGKAIKWFFVLRRRQR